MKTKILFVTILTFFSLYTIISIDTHTETTNEQTTEQPTTEQLTTEKTYNFLDIPLSKDLQIWLFEYCEEKQINPYLICAMCERESQYNTNAIGDNGNSIGLLQIQPRWHSERMNKLNCHNLLDEKQNLIVGIDILLDLFSINENVEWVLMAYNGGSDYANQKYYNGIITEYTNYIMTRMEELENYE